MIDFQGRHYSVRIGQIESSRLLLHPVTPLSIPRDAMLLVSSAEFGQIEARVVSVSERVITVEFAQINAAIEHLLALSDLQGQ